MLEISHPSPNFNTRGRPVSAILLHTTEGALAGALAWLCDVESRVSSHIVIAKTGDVYRLVDSEFRAWHAGVSELHTEPDLNDFSIGIELERLTNDPEDYPLAQLDSCAQFCAEACVRYSIALNRIVGHYMVAKPNGRKTDPKNFPWKQFLLDVSRRIPL